MEYNGIAMSAKVNKTVFFTTSGVLKTPINKNVFCLIVFVFFKLYIHI